MLRICFAWVALLVSQAVVADQWQWEAPCEAGADTKCEVWFNSETQYSDISARANDRALTLKFSGYRELKSRSANILLVQAAGLESGRASELKTGLTGLVTAANSFQSLGIYYSGSSLKPVATLGATPGSLTRGIAAVQFNSAAQHPDRHLGDVVGILGGSSVSRKVVYWITTGADVSDSQILQLKEKLGNDRIRLVIAHLQQSELSTNSAPALKKLATEANGLFVAIPPGKWATRLPALVNYANNGGKIDFNASALCGSTTVAFKAKAGSVELTEDWAGTYAACSGRTEPPAEADTPTEGETPAGGETTAEEETPAEAETPTEGETSAGGETTAEDETPAETETPAVEETTPTGDTPDGEDTTSGNGDAGDEQPKEAEAGHSGLWIAIIAGIAILLLIVVAVVFSARSRKAKPAAVEEVSQTAQVYGYLVEMRSTGEVRHELNKAAVKIGRSSDCNIVLQDDSVSVSHAVLKREHDGSVSVIDLDSSNGTRVNHEEVKQKTLKSGDIIDLGETRLRYEVFL